jgi:hypothetical protein
MVINILYPAQIDNSISLPTVFDNITLYNAEVLNRLKAAIIAVETELGVKPSGTYSTVRARLDAMQAEINSGGGPSGGVRIGQDLGGTNNAPLVVGLQGVPISTTAPTLGQTLIFEGISYVPGTNFYNQNITTTGQITSGPMLSTSETTGLFTLNGKFIVNSISGSPAVSDPSQGIIYYDATQNQFLVSQNGGAYVPLIGDNIETITPVTTNYPVVSSDRIIMVGTLSSNITITLPASPTVGQTLFIKDQKSSAQAHFITIAGNGNTIDGNANYIMNVNYEGVQLVYGSSGFWSIV